MNKRHITAYTKSIKPLQLCGKTVGYQLSFSGAFEVPFEVEPTEGEHDFKACEGCQNSIATLTKILTEKFEGKKGKSPFPLCCSMHQNLLKLKMFKRDSYKGVPAMVARKVVYTNQHIINNHSSANWYKVITDYIELMVESFGAMPKDCGEPLFLSDYFFYVTDLLKRNKEIQAEKKARLIEYLNAYNTPSESVKTDIKILLRKYEQWLAQIPFGVNSYFGSLKEHFEKRLPILNGKPEMNIYSGEQKVKIHTKGSLIEALVDLTNDLLARINGVALYERGLVTDANKIKLELVIESRKQKLKQGYKSNAKGEEQRYRKIVKEWFKDEKKFMDELAPLLKELQPQQTEAEQPQFKNTFDNVAEAEVYGHFKAGLVEKGYLSEPELNMFLKAAFELKLIPETLFKIQNAPKKAVIEAVFYQYYKNVAGKIHGKQPQYAALLGDYFEGYKTATVSSNFSKSVY